MRFSSRLAITATVVLLLAGALPASSSAEDGDGATVAILFDFGDGRSAWGFVPVPDPANAWCATLAAADQLGYELEYSFSQYGVFLEAVDGMTTPEDFSRYWGLWEWSDDDRAWSSSTVGALDLSIVEGDSVAWTFGAFGDPAPDPNPVTKDPWLSFRGGTGIQGVSNSPALPAAATFWAEELGNGPIDSTLAVANGKVFGITAGVFDWSSLEFTDLPTVFALNAFTGKLLWDLEFEGSAGFEIGSPTYHDGKVFAALSNRQVVALDVRNGESVWSTEVDGEGLTASPTVAGGMVLVGTGGGKLVALHTGNGTVAWEAPLGGGVYLAQPTVHEGTVYIGTENGTFHALSLANGSEVWTFEREGRFRGTPLVYDGAIYIIRGVYDGFIAKEGYLLALDMDGRMLWERDVGTTGSSPAVVGHVIVVGSTFGLRAFTTSGEAMWTFSDVGAVTSSPAIAGGHVYFMTNVNDPDAGLFTSVFSLSPHGTEDWRKELDPHDWALSSVAIADGRIYVATDAGWVYSLGDTAFSADFSWEADVGHVTVNDTSESVGARVVGWTYRTPGRADAEGPNTTLVFNASGDYPVELVAVDEFGREANVTRTVTVTVPDLVAGFTYEVDRLTVTFIANDTHPDLGGIEYSWEIEDASGAITGQVVTHDFEEGGKYLVVLTVTDEYGREATSSQVVEVREIVDNEGRTLSPEVALYLLLAFSVGTVLVVVALAMRGKKE
jgi:outer membrane protein assembly factor BamB